LVSNLWYYPKNAEKLAIAIYFDEDIKPEEKRFVKEFLKS